MRVEVFQDIPQQAVEIRHKVFITEQGFSYDLDDIDPLVRENLSFVLVNHMDQVLDTVFELHHAAAAPIKEEPVPAIPPQINVSHNNRATIRQ